MDGSSELPCGEGSMRSVALGNDGLSFLQKPKPACFDLPFLPSAGIRQGRRSGDGPPLAGGRGAAGGAASTGARARPQARGAGGGGAGGSRGRGGRRGGAGRAAAEEAAGQGQDRDEAAVPRHRELLRAGNPLPGERWGI